MEFEEGHPLTDELAAYLLVEYGGDYQRFKRSIMSGRRNALRWDEIVLSETRNTDLRQHAYNLIWYILGYLPIEAIFLPYEPMLRALASEHRSGRLREGFFEEVEFYAKHMRNADMRDYSQLPYTANELRAYHDNWHPYGKMARDRLVGFLDYEPPVEHSLEAELYLRDYLNDDTIVPTETIADYDLKAITMLLYREVLLTDGRDAADASPVEAAYYRELSPEDNRLWRGK